MKSIHIFLTALITVTTIAITGTGCCSVREDTRCIGAKSSRLVIGDYDYDTGHTEWGTYAVVDGDVAKELLDLLQPSNFTPDPHRTVCANICILTLLDVDNNCIYMVNLGRFFSSIVVTAGEMNGEIPEAGEILQWGYNEAFATKAIEVMMDVCPNVLLDFQKLYKSQYHGKKGYKATGNILELDIPTPSPNPHPPYSKPLRSPTPKP